METEEKKVDTTTIIKDTLRVYKGSTILVLPIKKLTQDMLGIKPRSLLEVSIRNTGMIAPPDSRRVSRKVLEQARE